MATATDISILEAQKREPGTKNAARRVRVGGKIPAVVYGAGKDAATVAVDPRQVLRILHSESGHNTIFDLALDSDRVKAMIVDWQFEPIKGTLLHVDLQAHRHGQEADGHGAGRSQGRGGGREDRGRHSRAVAA